jgi:arachidonate 15-lipoxygenase
LEESIGISAAFYQEWRLDEAAFPVEIASRKMDDSEVLPHYPFRDDGMLIWNSVQKFVDEYIALYYQSPEELAQDQELQNWARELAANEGGRVAGMPARIETAAQLSGILSTVIYTCAPLHSALNFAQYEYIGYVPNMPYAAYHPIPENGGMDKETLMKILPPYEQAALQLKWTEILTSYHYARLGHYDEKFEDPEAQAVIERFRQDLAVVEQKIEQRNRGRPLAYKYLKPSEIINSINT